MSEIEIFQTWMLCFWYLTDSAALKKGRGNLMQKQTFGLIVTNRSFFPAHLVSTAKKAVTEKLHAMGYEVITVTEKDTQYGAIVTYQEAKVCAELFQKHRKEISGILVILPNFGEETGVAEAIDLAGLNVPVLVQACDDDMDNLGLDNRRDAFCGKLSVCNNLRQRGIKYSLTSTHTCKIDSEIFTKDIEKFAGVCRVVTGMRGARIAAIGSRPNAFNTVRYSEKILQKNGITVCTEDMTNVIEAAKSMDDNAADVLAKVKDIQNYGTIPSCISSEKVLRQAKLCLALENCVAQYDCVASAVECWDAIENSYGCATCLGMSMMGEQGKPSACEMDVMGAVTMYAMDLAAQTPPAYMDWNNNVDDDRDCCITLHCSNFPKSFFGRESIEISNLDVLSATINVDKCFGACKAQVAGGLMTYAKISTDDVNGTMKMYVGSGDFLDTPVNTKGGVAICRVQGLQSLMQYLCKNGYEHHVAMCRGNVTEILSEAFSNYFGIEVYGHQS